MKNKNDVLVINKVTLSFPSEIEKEYQEYFFSDSIQVFRYAFIVVIFLYGMFGLLDNYQIDEDVNFFNIIRFAIVIPALLLVFAISFTRYFFKIWQWLLLFSYVLGGLGIIAMLAKAPFEYSYYLGLILVIFAGYFLIKLRFIFTSIGGWLLVLLFNLVMFNFSDLSANLIFTYDFFFVSANMLGMLASYYIELVYRRNYWLTINLNQKAELLNSQNNQLDELVKIRTFELEESQKKLNLLFETMSDMVVMHDIIFSEKNEPINYMITECNKAFTEITGINKEDAINKTADVVYQVPSAPYLKEYCGVATSGKSIRFETYFDPMKKYFSISVVPIGINKFATITMDITELKNFEHNLIEKNAQLERQYEEYMHLNEILRQTNLELEIAKSKAEESDKLKSAFLQNISHEIRTPLNGILGFTNLLQFDDLDFEERKEYITYIKKSSNRLQVMVDNIIEVSRISTGQVHLDKQEFIIKSLFHEINERNLQSAKDKGLDLLFESNNFENNTIYSDKFKLEIIFNSLVSNAIKFTNKGIITIGAVIKSSESKLYFYVKDTGIGIEKSLHEKIFENFFQVDDSISRHFEGAGLGLSICKGLLELLDGKIWVESELGKGSTFWFTIPYPCASAI